MSLLAPVIKLGSCGDPAGARLGVEKGVTGVGAAAEGCPKEKSVIFFLQNSVIGFETKKFI